MNRYIIWAASLVLMSYSILGLFIYIWFVFGPTLRNEYAIAGFEIGSVLMYSLLFVLCFKTITKFFKIKLQ